MSKISCELFQDFSVTRNWNELLKGRTKSDEALVKYKTYDCRKYVIPSPGIVCNFISFTHISLSFHSSNISSIQ
jgi:hypothetical protein